MKFWSSSEISPEADDAYRSIRKAADHEINLRTAKVAFEPVWEGWTWAFIAIIISPALKVDFPERVRRNNKHKDLEFRLRIDFAEFVAASHDRRIALVFAQLHRSVDLMAKWKVSAKDREALHAILDDVAKSPSVQAAVAAP